MELYPHHMRMWEKLKFQVPHCISGSSCRMRSRIIVAQKKSLVSKPMRFLRNAGFSFNFRRFNVFWLGKKKGHSSLFYNGAGGKRCRHFKNDL